MNEFLHVLGLTYSTLGSLSLARGFFVPQKAAMESGVSRWADEDDKKNLQLPQVQEKLRLRPWGVAGVTFIFIGFVLQLLSEVL